MLSLPIRHNGSSVIIVRNVQETFVALTISNEQHSVADCKAEGGERRSQLRTRFDLGKGFKPYGTLSHKIKRTHGQKKGSECPIPAGLAE